MSNGPTPSTGALSTNLARDTTLKDIGRKWSKFSRQELSDLKSNDDVVTQLVAKYGLAKAAAERDVYMLVDGRHLTA